MVEPHILVEGLPDFTRQLWSACPVEPYVLTAALQSSRIDHELTDERGALILRGFLGACVVPAIAARYPDLAKSMEDRIGDAVIHARRRFAVGAGQSVRAVSVGSHQSLWCRAHALIGAPHNWIREQADAEDLGAALGGRRYIRHLDDAFSARGIEFDWLRNAFPLLPSLPEPEAKYRKVARMARQALDEDEGLKDLWGAVSFLYWRTDATDWQPFSEPKGAVNKVLGTNEEGAFPFRRTDRLLEQYLYSRGQGRNGGEVQGSRFLDNHPMPHVEQGYECVLIKVLPTDPRRHSPCDNPIVTGAQLVMARDAEISAVLLDGERGVVAENDDVAVFDAALAAGILTPAQHAYWIDATREGKATYPPVYGI